MCMVSVIYDYGKRIPGGNWTHDSFSHFKEVIRRLDELDRKLSQPDCHDPAKAAWMREIEKRLSDVESTKQ